MPPDEFEDADAVDFADVGAAVDAAEHLDSQGVDVSRVDGRCRPLRAVRSNRPAFT